MASAMPSFGIQIVNHYNRMKQQASQRDINMKLVSSVREGHMRQLFPDELNLALSFEGVPIANFIDTVAKDESEGIAPLPALACVSGKMQSDADHKRAEMKNRIGDNYWLRSRLQLQMFSGADRFVTYGFLPFYVEPDVDEKMPRIVLDDPMGSYYELHRNGDCKVYAHTQRKTVDFLCAQFPEYASIIKSDSEGKEVSGDVRLEMVRWCDDEKVILLLPERQGLILANYKHKMSKTPAYILQRPALGDSPRGQFDDAIWVQVARAILTMLMLEAAHKAVTAPIALPETIDEFNIGPDAVLQSPDADKIRRVSLEIPQGTFAENQVLDQELKVGTRYPDARLGQSNASVITGKGVEALLGSFDTQIRAVQLLMKEALETVTSMCFEMDEKWWPNVTKTINGTVSGHSYEVSYTPRKDIAGRYGCTVTYGFATGMHPSQAIVTMLQLQGAGLISKATTMDNLPMPLDSLQESRSIDVEATREAIKQGLYALLGAAGPMAAQGQDPTRILKMAADVVKEIQGGATVEDAVVESFQQMVQEQQQQAAAQQPDQGASPGGDGGSGMPSDGLPPNVAPGQAGLPPGGLPTVQDMIAGFRGQGATPVNQAVIRRRIPTGT